MPSQYLIPDEYSDYGLADSTSPAAVQQASILLDAHLKRPEGLVYEVDVNGNPICMSSLTASATFTVAGGIPAGLNVTVTLAGPLQTLKKGAVLVADRLVPESVESLTVGAINGAQVTFASVARTHGTQTTLEAGLAIAESKHLPTGRMVTVLSRGPIVGILGIEGRFGPTRRGRYQPDYSDSLQGIVGSFFMPGMPVAESVDVNYVDFNADTGEIWLPCGLYTAPYTDINVSYLAGFTKENIPSVVKQTVADLVNAQQKSPLAGNIKSFQSGDSRVERFIASLMSDDQKSAIRQYEAKAYA